MRIPFFGRRETREAAEPRTFTSDQVTERVSSAKGLAAGAMAGIEAAAGAWERAFMSAEAPSLAPWQLAVMGRSLLMRGASVWRVRGADLEVVSSHDIRGRTGRPSSWVYRLSVPAPETTRTFKSTSADSVVHVRIGATAERPWEGVSPLESSGGTRTILASLERQLREESSGAVGSLIPVAAPDQAVADTIAQLSGMTLQVEGGDSGLGQDSKPGQEWSPKRLGFNAPASLSIIRSDVQRALLAAAGVPVELVDPGAAGSAGAREAWRRFIHATIQPVASLVSAELSRVGLDGEISFERLFASDLQGRARAFASLVNAGSEGNGISVSDARRICGFG